MSQKLLRVAEMKSVLDQFKEPSRLLPANGNQVGFNFNFTALETNQNWMRVQRNTPYSTYVFGRNDWDFGGMDFGVEPEPLETRSLSTLDRLELEKLELF